MPRYFNASIRNLVYRLRKFKDILDDELKNTIEDNGKYLTDCVRLQLDMGLDGNMRRIIPPYALSTIKKKIKKGQPYDRVTLKDTGEFYESLYVEFDSGGFRILSNDEKVKYLIAKYGEAILRIDNEDFTRFIRFVVRPELQEKLKEKLLNDRT